MKNKNTKSEKFTKQVLITSFSLDLSEFSFDNIEKHGDVDELNLLKKWIFNGDVLTLTLSKTKQHERK